MASVSNFQVDRKALSVVFKDPRTLRAFESLLQAVSNLPSDASALPQAGNDAEAASAGVNIGEPYMNGSFLCYRMN